MSTTNHLFCHVVLNEVQESAIGFIFANSIAAAIIGTIVFKVFLERDFGTSFKCIVCANVRACVCP